MLSYFYAYSIWPHYVSCAFIKHFYLVFRKANIKYHLLKPSEQELRTQSWIMFILTYFDDHLFQWMVDGLHGLSGQCVTADVAAVSRNAHAAAPIQHHSMAVPSVKGKASRSWRVILSAQVRHKIPIHPLISGQKRFRCTQTKYIKYDATYFALFVPPPLRVSLSHISHAVSITYLTHPLMHLFVSIRSSAISFTVRSSVLVLCGSGWPVDRVE